MTRALLLALSLLMLTNCGIRRPLIPPRDIPEYEAKKQKRLDKMNEDAEQDEPAAQGR